MISFLVVIGFAVIAFGLLVIGLLLSKYKRREENPDRCFGCPIRMLIKYPCDKEHRKNGPARPSKESEIPLM